MKINEKLKLRAKLFHEMHRLNITPEMLAEKIGEHPAIMTQKLITNLENTQVDYLLDALEIVGVKVHRVHIDKGSNDEDV